MKEGMGPRPEMQEVGLDAQLKKEIKQLLEKAEDDGFDLSLDEFSLAKNPDGSSSLSLVINNHDLDVDSVNQPEGPEFAENEFFVVEFGVITFDASDEEDNFHASIRKLLSKYIKKDKSVG